MATREGCTSAGLPHNMYNRKKRQRKYAQAAAPYKETQRLLFPIMQQTKEATAADWNRETHGAVSQEPTCGMWIVRLHMNSGRRWTGHGMNAGRHRTICQDGTILKKKSGKTEVQSCRPQTKSQPNTNCKGGVGHSAASLTVSRHHCVT